MNIKYFDIMEILNSQRTVLSRMCASEIASKSDITRFDMTSMKSLTVYFNTNVTSLY